ncbi:hypothetical protein PAP_04350 [Palaeococcus pacificus DY20341]|uniref:Uncharacterized protein n=1 Tax=Palaeococcus pacificus DY20341 TaxID=1343739 RepID=A0A075LSK8_9EURY|nr:hypothetical protein PAP_04350 [Palaeococcus pacificus DY20341]
MSLLIIQGLTLFAIILYCGGWGLLGGAPEQGAQSPGAKTAASRGARAKPSQ